MTQILILISITVTNYCHHCTGKCWLVAVWDAVYTRMLARVQWRKIKSW